ncbi:MAG: Hsp20/alpha crystallin family protein [Sporolactobacillus sp.]
MMEHHDPRDEKPVVPRNLMNDLEAFFQQNPFQDVLKSIDEFFESSGHTANHFPVHLSETKQNWIIEAELPGVRKDAIHVELLDSGVRIIVENDVEMETEHKEKGTYMLERHFDHAERTVAIPYVIDRKRTRAAFADGLLRIEGSKFPKTGNTLTIDE